MAYPRLLVIVIVTPADRARESFPAVGVVVKFAVLSRRATPPLVVEIIVPPSMVVRSAVFVANTSYFAA